MCFGIFRLGLGQGFQLTFVSRLPRIHNAYTSLILGIVVVGYKRRLGFSLPDDGHIQHRRICQIGIFTIRGLLFPIGNGEYLLILHRLYLRSFHAVVFHVTMIPRSIDHQNLNDGILVALLCETDLTSQFHVSIVGAHVDTDHL